MICRPGGPLRSGCRRVRQATATSRTGTAQPSTPTEPATTVRTPSATLPGSSHQTAAATTTASPTKASPTPSRRCSGANRERSSRCCGRRRRAGARSPARWRAGRCRCPAPAGSAGRGRSCGRTWTCPWTWSWGATWTAPSWSSCGRTYASANSSSATSSPTCCATAAGKCGSPHGQATRWHHASHASHAVRAPPNPPPRSEHCGCPIRGFWLCRPWAAQPEPADGATRTRGWRNQNPRMGQNLGQASRTTGMIIGRRRCAPLTHRPVTRRITCCSW